MMSLILPKKGTKHTQDSISKANHKVLDSSKKWTKHTQDSRFTDLYIFWLSPLCMNEEKLNRKSWEIKLALRFIFEQRGKREKEKKQLLIKVP